MRRDTIGGRVAVISAPLASAVLYALAFPPFRLRPLAWIALVPILVAVRLSPVRLGILLSWVFTVSTAYLSGTWFSRAVTVYYGQPWWVGLALFLAVSSLTAAPCIVALAGYRWLARAARPSSVLLTAAIWVAGELCRSRLVSRNPWVLLGYSQAGAEVWIQIADLAGVYGVSFVLAAASAAVAEVCLAVVRRGKLRDTAPGLLAAACLAAASWAYGAHHLAHAESEAARATTIPVGIVQANLDLGAQWRRELYGKNLDTYLRLTRDLLRDSSPRIVFWPENAMTFFLEEEPAYRRVIGSLLTFGDVELVAGGPRFLGSRDSPVFYNSAFLLAPDGEVTARYDKRQLLPFAEYFPFGWSSILRRNFGRVREFEPGRATPPLPTRAGRAGVVICNEVMFPEIVIERVRVGAEYLVNLSNDSWLNDRTYAEITLNMAIFRAVEQRRYLVRASTSGPSAIVDPEGHVPTRSDALDRAVRAGAIEPRRGRTVYSRVGDSFAGACTLWALALVTRRLLRRRPRVRDTTTAL